MDFNGGVWVLQGVVELMFVLYGENAIWRECDFSGCDGVEEM